MIPTILGAPATGSFIVSPNTLNEIEISSSEKVKFPGNIAPEGYFYSPFFPITLKELDDEIQSINVKRINFDPKKASVEKETVTFYDPQSRLEEEKEMTFIKIVSPVKYDILAGQPFCVYDILEDRTHRGHLDSIDGQALKIAATVEIDEPGLRGLIEGSGGKSRYIISFLEENAPEYAEFLPTTQKLVWRGPKKMSDVSSESPIYNMPFTNGRLYVHKNIDVFVRRQDPNNDYKLFKPSPENPLRRFQIEGDAKLDFDYIQTIIDSMVDAC